MIVEILKDYHLPETKLTRDDKPYTVQKAFVHLGGAFPQEIEIRVESAAHAYGIGKYSISMDSFQVNQYRKLEINNYRMRLEPLSNSVSKVS
jgi:hypothetical protein